MPKHRGLNKQNDITIQPPIMADRDQILNILLDASTGTYSGNLHEYFMDFSQPALKVGSGSLEQSDELLCGIKNYLDKFFLEENQINSKPKYLYLVAKNDKGVVCGVITYHIDDKDNNLHIDILAVNKEFSKNRLAQKLIASVVDIAKKNNCNHVYAISDGDSDTFWRRHFYEEDREYYLAKHRFDQYITFAQSDKITDLFPVFQKITHAVAGKQDKASASLASINQELIGWFSSTGGHIRLSANKENDKYDTETREIMLKTIHLIEHYHQDGMVKDGIAAALSTLNTFIIDDYKSKANSQELLEKIYIKLYIYIALWSHLNNIIKLENIRVKYIKHLDEFEEETITDYLNTLVTFEYDKDEMGSPVSTTPHFANTFGIFAKPGSRMRKDDMSEDDMSEDDMSDDGMTEKEKDAFVLACINYDDESETEPPMKKQKL